MLTVEKPNTSKLRRARRPGHLMILASVASALFLIGGCTDDSSLDATSINGPTSAPVAADGVKSQDRETLKRMLDCAADKGVDLNTGRELLDQIQKDFGPPEVLECFKDSPEFLRERGKEFAEVLNESLR